jgi:ribosomal protein S7
VQKIPYKAFFTAINMLYKTLEDADPWRGVERRRALAARYSEQVELRRLHGLAVT